MGKSRSTTTGQSRFIEQYWKVISGILFAALALGYATNILKKLRRVFFLPDRVMSVWKADSLPAALMLGALLVGGGVQ